MSYRKSPWRSRRSISGSSVRRILADDRTSTEPPEKKRSGLHVRPLRSMKGLVDPTIIRRSSPLTGAVGTAPETELDLAPAETGLARSHHDRKAPAVNTTATAQAMTSVVNSPGRARIRDSAT